MAWQINKDLLFLVYFQYFFTLTRVNKSNQFDHFLEFLSPSHRANTTHT